MMAVEIKLILGDCLTVMKTMADKSVDVFAERIKAM